MIRSDMMRKVEYDSSFVPSNVGGVDSKSKYIGTELYFGV